MAHCFISALASPRPPSSVTFSYSFTTNLDWLASPEIICSLNWKFQVKLISSESKWPTEYLPSDEQDTVALTWSTLVLKELPHCVQFTFAQLPLWQFLHLRWWSVQRLTLYCTYFHFCYHLRAGFCCFLVHQKFPLTGKQILTTTTFWQNQS